MTGDFQIRANPFVAINQRVLVLVVSPMRSNNKPNACITPHSAIAGVTINSYRSAGAFLRHRSFRAGGAFALIEFQINPPVEPLGAGSAKALVNSQFWDPIQRAGSQ